MDYLLERIECLERANRRLRVLVVTLVIFWLLTPVLIVLGTPPSRAQAVPDVKVVRAQQFVVEDAQGRTLATLGVVTTGPEAGGVGLHVAGPDGMVRLAVAVSRDGDGLIGGRRGSGPGAMLVVPRRGSATLSVLDSEGREATFPPAR